MNRGFFESLLDVSFTSFVTTKLIKVLYILTLVFIGLGYLVYLVVAFAADSTLGIIWMFIIGPLIVFFSVLVYRVLYELIIVIFRIFENTRDQLALQRSLHPEAAAHASGMDPAVASTEVLTASAPPALTCPSCANPVAATDKFCQSCGAGLGTPGA